MNREYKEVEIVAQEIHSIGVENWIKKMESQKELPFIKYFEDGLEELLIKELETALIKEDYDAFIKSFNEKIENSMIEIGQKVYSQTQIPGKFLEMACQILLNHGNDLLVVQSRFQIFPFILI